MALMRRNETRRPGRSGEFTAPSSIFDLRSEMDRLFDSFFEPGGGNGARLAPWTPSVDLSETDDRIRVTAEIPGVNVEDLDISVQGDVLTISGQKEEEKTDEQEDFYRSERHFGSFVRRVPLPAPVDSENVDARFRRGVLTITMNKTESARPRRIEIQES